MDEESTSANLGRTPTEPLGGGGMRQLADSVLKYLPLLGAIFYGLGIVIANLFLVQFGVADFAIFKPQCIITGIWAGLLLILAGLPAFSWCRAIENHWDDKPRVRTLAAIKLYIASIGAATAFASILAFTLGVSRYNSSVPFGSWIALIAIMSLPLVGVVRGRGGPSPRSSYAVLCGGFALVGFFAIMLIAYGIYPYVSADRAGGRPVHAAFFFNKEGQDVIAAVMKQQIATSPTQSPNALGGDIIEANSQYFLVLFDFQTALRETKKPVEIERRLVNAYMPDDAPPAGETK